MVLANLPGTAPIIFALQTMDVLSCVSLSLTGLGSAGIPDGHQRSLTCFIYSATWSADVSISTWSTMRLQMT